MKPIVSKRYNITAAHEVFASRRKVLQFTVTDEDVVAVNITGFALRFRLYRRGQESQAMLVTKTIGSGVTITSGAGGVAQVVIDAADMTMAASPDNYAYMLDRTDADNEDVAAYGDFVVLAAP